MSNSVSKTLIVYYTPRQEKSVTKNLMQYFVEKVQEKTSVEMLDLLENQPKPFDTISSQAYGMRNYGKMTLSGDLADSLESFDKNTAQFKATDVIVLAFPMYNFGMPGIVKTYLDSVLLKGETWDMDANGYKGLMGGKKLLTIYTSGGVYSEENGMKDWDGIKHSMEITSKFLGFDESEIISAQGVNGPNKEEVVEIAKTHLDELIKKWYL